MLLKHDFTRFPGLSFIVGSNAIKNMYYLCHILLVFANIFIPPIAYHCATFCNQPKAVSIYAGSHFFRLSTSFDYKY